MSELWVSVSGALAQQRNVDTIANNIANANTAGFKKDQLVFKEYLTALNKGADQIDLPRQEWKPADFYKSYGSELAYTTTDGSYTQFTQGQLSPTNRPLDLGIQGGGMLEVLTPYGVRFTRNGQLGLDQQGFLVTREGHYLLSNVAERNAESVDGAESRKIKIQDGKIPTFGHNGDIYNGESKIGQLSLVDFKDINALKKQGNGLYTNPELANIQQSKSTILQGFIEESNVNTMEEMSNLIKAHRHFESIQRAIKTYDGMSSKGANEIGKF